MARKNPVGCFLSGCGDQCIAEHLSESATQLVVDQAWEADMLLGSSPPRALLPPHDAAQVPTPSPKLESIGRPRRPPPLYILMSSISSHWTIPPPLTLCTFISDPIWPPQEVECIIKTLKLKILNILWDQLWEWNKTCWAFCASLCFYSCLLSCLLLSLQINVLLS